jgi:hypothetical protein
MSKESVKGYPVDKLSIDGVFIERYKSIRQAGILNGIGPSNIRLVCDGYRYRTGKFKWEYAKLNKCVCFIEAGRCRCEA